MGEPAEDLGYATDLEVIERLVPLSGQSLIDVGCGDGALARVLAERGATVLGVEADPIRAEANRAAPTAERVTLVEGVAQALPVADGSVDGVIFSKSLHHVPVADMAQALVEARRALRPETGYLYVFEPMVDGPFSDLLRPFHDETDARRAAREAMRDLVPRLFAAEREVRYTITAEFDDFEALVSRMAGHTYNEYQRQDIETDAVRSRFETGRDGDIFRFDQPMRGNLFQTDAAVVRV